MLITVLCFSIAVFIAALGIVKKYDAERATWFIIAAWSALTVGLVVR